MEATQAAVPLAPKAAAIKVMVVEAAAEVEVAAAVVVEVEDKEMAEWVKCLPR
jgi:phage baseplate assembly protein gpV